MAAGVLPCRSGRLERIPDGQVESETVLETGNVVVALLVRVRIGGVQADAEVGADDQVADVVAQSEARSQRDVVQEAFPFEFGPGTFGVFLQQPDVSGVEEDGPVEPAHDAEAVFDVGFQFKVARLVEVAVAVVRGRAVAARAERPDGEGADAVGAADVELFAVRHHLRIAIGVARADEETRRQPVVAAADAVVELHFADLLDELRKTVAEEGLGLPLAEGPQDARKQVAGRRDAVLPVEAPVARGAVGSLEGVGVVDRGHELVAETHGDGRIFVHRPVEGVGRVEQFVVGELEDRQRMAAVRGGLEVVARRTAEGDQPEEAGTVHQVDAQLERRAPRVFLPARHAPGQQQPRDVEVGVQPQFVGVEPRGASPGVLVARLPFVGAVQLHGEDLAAAEEVVVADPEGDARADEAVRLRGDVGLQGRLQRVVEPGVDLHVERVGAAQRVERRDAQVDGAEDPQFVEVGLRPVLGVDGEELPGPERQGAGQDPGADFQRPPGDDGRVRQAQRIRRAGFDVGQADRDVAHAVGHEGRLRNVRPEVQAQGDLPSAGGRVGQVLHVFGTEIVVAPVAEQLGDAFAFERERVEVVLRPDAQQGGGLQAVDQLFQTPDGLRIGDGRIVPCGCDAERVPDFRLAAALAVEQGVGGAGAEVPVIFEDLLGDLRAQLRLYLGDQHRLFGQPLVEPVFESFLLRRIEVVVGPQPDGQRGAEVGAVKRIVRCDRQRFLHRRLGRRSEHDARIRLDEDLFHARIQHLVAPQPPGGGAGGRQQHGAEGQNDVSDALRTHFFGFLVLGRIGLNRSPSRDSFLRMTKPTPVSVISPSRMLS